EPRVAARVPWRRRPLRQQLAPSNGTAYPAKQRHYRNDKLGSIGSGRIGPVTLIPEPLFPIGRLVRPLLRFDTPSRWRPIEENLLTLTLSQATGDHFLGAIDEGLPGRKDSPNARRVIRAAGDHALTIGAEGCAPHHCVMPVQDGVRSARFNTPQTRCIVGGGSNDVLTIGAERAGPYRVGMSRKNGRLLACFHGPQTRRLVCRGRDQVLTIGAERGTPHLALMPLETCGQLARFGVP